MLSELKYIKLSDLAKKIAEVIKQSFGFESYWIIAEISGHKFYPNQDRHYFEFIEKAEESQDPIAKIKGISWRAGSQSIKLFENATGQTFTNGLQVLVNVKVEFHSAYGFSLILNNIDPSFTLGNLEKQRQATLVKLLIENPESIKKIGDEYVTKNKSIVLSAVIQKIAIIGSPNSEGYTDFMHTISNNQFKYKFSADSYQSAVQGVGAEKELVNKLVSIYDSKKKYDCVVIIRGGGSKTDFLVFETYELSRAVARFPIPVITGIGHHKDVSIVDLMVHTSTKTPTKAAEFIISHNRQFEDSVVGLQKAIIIKSQQLLGNAIQRINSSNIIIINRSRTLIGYYKDKMQSFNQIVINKTKTILYERQTNLVTLLNKLLSKPKIISAHRQSELQNLVNNLKIFSNKYLINKRGYLGHYDSVIRLVSPQNILKRGFAIISQNGTILKNPESISIGDTIKITMAEYEMNSKIITKIKTNGTEPNV